jgi:hypothetical protein
VARSAFSRFGRGVVSGFRQAGGAATSIDSQPKFSNDDWLQANLATSFEAIVLPEFAQWLRELVRAEEPSLLMPVETKGARLIDATIDYLNREEATSLRVPIRLRRSLDYTERASLVGKNVLVIDDATRTGRTLNRYRKRVADCSPEANVVLAACFGALNEDGTPRKRVHNEIRCFREYRPELYRENAWQLASMVASAGLPPEVDHHQFRFKSALAIARHWTTLVEQLREFGVLDDFGAVSADGLLYGATLHWPTFAPRRGADGRSPVQPEGVVKLRVFGDVSTDEIVLVPLAYPKITLPRAKGRPAISLEQASDIYRSWLGGNSGVGDVLISSATPDSWVGEVLFNAVSLTDEVGLLAAGTRILSDFVDPASVAFDERHMVRLYGDEVSARLVSAISEQLREGSNGLPPSAPRLPSQDGGGVDRQTGCLVHFLKSGYIEQNKDLPEADWKPFSLSFAELQGVDACSETQDPLTLSRCLDFGLAVGSLVPATRMDVVGANVVIRRKYRTSEQADLDDDGTVLDLQWSEEDVAKETVAAIVHFLRTRSRRWHGRPVPVTEVNKILAVLHTAMPEMSRASIAIKPREHGPEAYVQVSRYQGAADLVDLRNAPSAHYRTTGEGLEPTEVFEKRNAAGELVIERRGLLRPLESHLTVMVPVLDETQNVMALLLPWAMCAAGRLGLNYVMHDLDLALRELEKPIELLRGGRELDVARLTRTVGRARHFVGVARTEKVAELKRDWASELRARWSEPLSIERALLRSTYAFPGDHAPIFDLAHAFCNAVESFIAIVGTLSVYARPAPQSSLFDDAGIPGQADRDVGIEDSDEVSRSAIADASGLVTALRSMRDRTDSTVWLGSSPDRAVAVAEHLRKVMFVLRRYMAAFAWRLDRFPEESRPRGTRNSVVLYTDIAGSTRRSQESGHVTNTAWKNDGLNLIYQWGLAFGARELPQRRGDDIVLEFVDADSAVLAATMAQEHLSALRLTNDSRLHYETHCGIDQDWVTDVDGENRISAAFDRAAKLSKGLPNNTIGVTEEVARECSGALQRFLAARGEPIHLDSDASRGHFTPHIVDREGLLSAYAARLSGVEA